MKFSGVVGAVFAIGFALGGAQALLPRGIGVELAWLAFGLLVVDGVLAIYGMIVNAS